MKQQEPDRQIPRMDGGTYDSTNVIYRHPVEHAEVEGRIRHRDPEIDTIKTLMDDRRKIMQTINGVNNKLFAWGRGIDSPSEILTFIEGALAPFEKKLLEIDKSITKTLIASSVPIVEVASGVRGIGPITIAGMLAYVDMNKAPNPSSLWSYVGFDQPAYARKTNDKERIQQLMERRRIRGHAFYCTGPSCSFCHKKKEDPNNIWNKEGIPMGWGGNQTLRTILYTASESWMKNRKSAYRLIYDQTKARLEISEKITLSRKTGRQGLHENAWKDAPKGHRHGAALRAMMKVFLFDYWFSWRTLEGLPTRLPYAIEKLGHTGFSHPRERGWEI